MPRLFCLALTLLLASTGAAHAATAATEPAAPADAAILDAFLKLDTLKQIKLSPDGTYIAISVPLSDKTVLATLKRADLSLVSKFALRGKAHVEGFWWVSNQRVVFSISEKEGRLEEPQLTGELYATDVDGNRQTILTGYRSSEMQLGTHIGKRTDTDVYSEYVGRIPGDEGHILAAVSHAHGNTYEGGQTSLDRVDVATGLRKELTWIPIVAADFTLDHAGRARFAAGEDETGYHRLYYRAQPDGEWKIINDEAKSGLRMYALGFKADDSVAYLNCQEESGPNGLYAMDVASGQKHLLNKDARVDPSEVIYAHDGLTPIALMYSNGKPHAYYIDPSAPEARLMMSLQEQSFPDEAVRYVNGSSDGSLSLFHVSSDRDPGSYYVYDANSKKASLLISNMEWLNSEAMAEVKPIEFKARDGQLISGLLTVPHNHGSAPMPLIVYPHGGPIGVDDAWGFNSETQMMAARGYAVLQVNFRGSGNYGRKFMEAGFREWGAAIQDDITDATRWAIAQGGADPKRICIYGSSFGAYAALMGAAREPSLYRCAVGYVGVYNLALMRSKGDISRTKSGRLTLLQELGEDPQEIASRSPTNLAAQIKIPVFLATAGRDERAPQAHSEQMRDKLTSAGNAPEWLDFPTEGHGYYTQEHQREFYEKLFAFLDRNLGR